MEKLLQEAVRIVKKCNRRSSAQACSGAPTGGCVHELVRLGESRDNIILQPSDFHTHWFIRYEPSQPPQDQVLEPAVI